MSGKRPFSYRITRPNGGSADSGRFSTVVACIKAARIQLLEELSAEQVVVFEHGEKRPNIVVTLVRNADGAIELCNRMLAV